MKSAAVLGLFVLCLSTMASADPIATGSLAPCGDAVAAAKKIGLGNAQLAYQTWYEAVGICENHLLYAGQLDLATALHENKNTCKPESDEMTAADIDCLKTFTTFALTELTQSVTVSCAEKIAQAKEIPAYKAELKVGAAVAAVAVCAEKAARAAEVSVDAKARVELLKIAKFSFYKNSSCGSGDEMVGIGYGIDCRISAAEEALKGMNDLSVR